MWPYFYDFMIWKGKIREVQKTNQEVRKWGRSFEMKRTKRFFLRGFFTPLLRSWSVRHMECVSVYWSNLCCFQFFAPRPRWWFPLKGSFFQYFVEEKTFTVFLFVCAEGTKNLKDTMISSIPFFHVFLKRTCLWNHGFSLPRDGCDQRFRKLEKTRNE